MNYLILFFGIILIIDSVTNFDLFSSEFLIKYLGKKREKYFSIFVGIFLILFSMYLFIFHNN